MSPRYLADVIERESSSDGAPKNPAIVYLGDAASLPGLVRNVETVVTDPPYFDAIGYADLSDYFYVWLKRGLGEQFPEVFATPQTPKRDEAVAHKHRHHGNRTKATMAVAREHGLFVVHGSSCRLALLKDRSDKKHLGDEADSPLIDQLHHALRLWKGEKRDELVEYLAEHELTDHAPFWKLAQALFEVLPRDIEDWKLISALLGERESLRTQAKRTRLL